MSSYITTTTDIARNGKKAFDGGIKEVFSNNSPIGYIIGHDYYEAIKASGLIEQLREEMKEANDPETAELIKNYNNGDMSQSIDLDDFRAKYDV